ncbi:MAG TPA: DNA-formamidopyrimidine glycosylase family protein, partial [Burkholderiales bacterium]|nr:DNA-formamidopyrimidine glycosylase family protein [Burkholderiales bacterium]
MPELPDVTAYLDALRERIGNARLEKIRLFNPFLLRTAVPPIASAEGKRVIGLRRLGKRVVIELEGQLFLVLHLMIAGRLHWQGKKTRSTLALFE